MLDAERRELERRDLPIDLLGHRVDAGRRARPARRASCSAASACSANEMSITAAGCPSAAARLTTRPAGEQVQPPAAEDVLLDERAHLAHGVGAGAQRLEVDLDVEVPGVGEHGAVLHPLEVLARAARRARPSR